MKIVDIAVKKVYRFNCPNCQSRLEADSSELTDIGGKVSKRKLILPNEFERNVIRFSRRNRVRR